MVRLLSFSQDFLALRVDCKVLLAAGDRTTFCARGQNLNENHFKPA